MSSFLEQSVYQTIAFFDKLDFCLTAEEISERLLGSTAVFGEIEMVLSSSTRIGSKGGFYFLSGRDVLVQLRKDREGMHDVLMRKVERYRWIFRMVPGLRAVYVCNRLAIAQARETSDIDLFVVVRGGRMFTTRFFLLFFLQIFGLRIHPKKRFGRFCPSFFVDETQLNFESLLLQPRDQYFAYWVLLLKPVLGRIDLRAANPWLTSYFSEDVLRRSLGGVCVDMSRRDAVFFGGALESFLRRWQLKKLSRKYPDGARPKGVVISDGCLKFHEDDRRHLYV